MNSLQTHDAPVAPSHVRRPAGRWIRTPRVHMLNPHLAHEMPESLEDAEHESGLLSRLLDRGIFTPTQQRAYVVYQLEHGGRVHTGLLAEVSVDAYRQGRVRRHEATCPDRESKLTESRHKLKTELVPVTLTFAGHESLGVRLAESTAGEPDVTISSPDGLVQRAWVITDEALTHALHAELDLMDALYIADGHHRMAAAQRHDDQHSDKSGAHFDPDERGSFVLAAIFPPTEMRILGYHRCVRMPEGYAASDVLDALAVNPAVERVTEVEAATMASPAKRAPSMHIDGRWYRLDLREWDSCDPRTDLDVVMLDERILQPLLSSVCEPSDSRVSAVAGTTDHITIERRCADHREVAFLLHPPTIDQVIDVADTGLVMPPKSTWFEPKARSGPFLRRLD